MHHYVVLVLGDLGRSPRILYHANSLSKIPDASVTLIGYKGEKLPSFVAQNERIRVSYISTLDFNYLRVVSLIHAFARGLSLLISVFLALWSIGRFDVILVQNPPCLPALLAINILRLFSCCKVMLDWHNLGFTMFEDRLGLNHPLVKLARWLEKVMCVTADSHLCVSLAMKEWLGREFKVQAHVLYDRPASVFSVQTPTLDERHALLVRHNFTHSALFPSLARDQEERVEGETIQTVQIDARVREREHDRVAVVVSSTSWTPDEDFSLLLRALILLERTLMGMERDSEPVVFRKVLVVVTGKGPLKGAFEAEVALLASQGQLKRVVVRTVWLEPGEYPLLLRCADVGVCLHTSTSGLDLPMKVLDMFGSGLPVCAVSFPALHELVKHGENGLVFDSAEDLARLLTSLLTTPRGLQQLAGLRQGTRGLGGWDQQWTSVVPPLLEPREKVKT